MNLFDSVSHSSWLQYETWVQVAKLLLMTFSFSDVSADESVEIEALDTGVASTISGTVHIYVDWLPSAVRSVDLVWPTNWDMDCKVRCGFTVGPLLHSISLPSSSLLFFPNVILLCIMSLCTYSRRTGFTSKTSLRCIPNISTFFVDCGLILKYANNPTFYIIALMCQPYLLNAIRKEKLTSVPCNQQSFRSQMKPHLWDQEAIMCSLVKVISHIRGSNKRAWSNDGIMIRKGELKKLWEKLSPVPVHH